MIIGVVFAVILATFQAFCEDFRPHRPDKIYNCSGIAAIIFIFTCPLYEKWVCALTAKISLEKSNIFHPNKEFDLY